MIGPKKHPYSPTQPDIARFRRSQKQGEVVVPIREVKRVRAYETPFVGLSHDSRKESSNTVRLSHSCFRWVAKVANASTYAAYVSR